MPWIFKSHRHPRQHSVRTGAPVCQPNRWHDFPVHAKRCGTVNINGQVRPKWRCPACGGSFTKGNF